VSSVSKPGNVASEQLIVDHSSLNSHQNNTTTGGHSTDDEIDALIRAGVKQSINRDSSRSRGVNTRSIKQRAASVKTVRNMI
jgi:hypothetical protein